ncbi:MAG TPA: hypothetical protein PKV73_09385 [Agriterribacter sp.]|nr:hypothetical protein [Agriterribacter sp.]
MTETYNFDTVHKFDGYAGKDTGHPLVGYADLSLMPPGRIRRMIMEIYEKPT